VYLVSISNEYLCSLIIMMAITFSSFFDVKNIFRIQIWVVSGGSECVP